MKADERVRHHSRRCGTAALFTPDFRLQFRHNPCAEFIIALHVFPTQLEKPKILKYKRLCYLIENISTVVLLLLLVMKLLSNISSHVCPQCRL